MGEKYVNYNLRKYPAYGFRDVNKLLITTTR